MELPALPPVIDLDELHLLQEDKEYRDSYLESSVRTGIGSQVQAIRQQRNLTQRDLASLTGTTQSSISRLEDEQYGRVSVQTLLSIAKATETALIIRFAPYDEFLRFAKNLSPAALQVPTISESIEKIQTHQQVMQFFNSPRIVLQTLIPPTKTRTGVLAAVVGYISTGIFNAPSAATIDGVQLKSATALIQNTGEQ